MTLELQSRNNHYKWTNSFHTWALHYKHSKFKQIISWQTSRITANQKCPIKDTVKDTDPIHTKMLNLMFSF